MSSPEQYSNIKEIKFPCTIQNLIDSILAKETIIKQIPSKKNISGEIIAILEKSKPDPSSASPHLTILLHLNIMCDLLGLDKNKLGNIYDKYNSIVHSEHEIIVIDPKKMVEHIIRLYIHDYVLYTIKIDIQKKINDPGCEHSTGIL